MARLLLLGSGVRYGLRSTAGGSRVGAAPPISAVSLSSPHFLLNPAYSSPHFLLNPAYSSPPIATSTVAGSTSILFLSAATPGAGGTEGSGGDSGGTEGSGGDSGGQKKKGRGKKWWRRAWNFYEEKIRDPLDHFNRVGNGLGFVMGFGMSLMSVYTIIFIKDDFKKYVETFLTKVSDDITRLTISWEEIANIPFEMEVIMEQMRQLVDRMELKEKEGGDGGEGEGKKDMDGEGEGE